MGSTLLKIMVAGLAIGSATIAFAAATPYDAQLSALGHFVATSRIGTHKNLELIRPFIASKSGDRANALVLVSAIRGAKECGYEGVIAYEATDNQQKITKASSGLKLASLHRAFSGTAACSQLTMAMTGLVTYELEAITSEYVYEQKIARGAEQERLISARMGEPFSFGNRDLDLNEMSPVTTAPKLKTTVANRDKATQTAAAPVRVQAPAVMRVAAEATPPRFYQSSGIKLVATPKSGRVVVRADSSVNSRVVAAISGSTDLALETCGRNGWLKWNNVGYIRASDIRLIAPAVGQI